MGYRRRAGPEDAPLAFQVGELWRQLLGTSTRSTPTAICSTSARVRSPWMRAPSRIAPYRFRALSAAQIYEHPSVARLAAWLGGAVRRPSADLVNRGERQRAALARSPRVRSFCDERQTRRQASPSSAWPGVSPTRPTWTLCGATSWPAAKASCASAPTSCRRWCRRRLRSHPRYVAARGVIADADRFDAAFFGVLAARSAADRSAATYIHGIVLECAGACRGPPARVRRQHRRIRRHVEQRATASARAQPQLLDGSGEFAGRCSAMKRTTSPRASRTGSSSARTGAEHSPRINAAGRGDAGVVRADETWQCDLALAGGINVVVPQESGYLPVESGDGSPDGHCRPFDAERGGTVFSSGGAVVALKRTADAIAAGDTIYAVIRGVGVNNDGGDKVGFTRAERARAGGRDRRWRSPYAGVGARRRSATSKRTAPARRSAIRSKSRRSRSAFRRRHRRTARFWCARLDQGQPRSPGCRPPASPA